MTNMSVDDIDDAVTSLSRIRQRLVLAGQLTFVATIAHVLVALATLGRFWQFGFGIQASLFLIVVTAAAALVFESLRRRGNALFEEISDEFQWHLTEKYRDALPSSDAPRPPLRYRVELRSFSRASDLPLAPGLPGPAAYVLINIALAITLVIRSYSARGF